MEPPASSAPEHPLNETLLDVESKTGPGHGDAARAAIPAISRRKVSFTGHYAINPYNGREGSHLVANFVADGLARAHHRPSRRTTERDFGSAVIRTAIRPDDSSRRLGRLAC